MKARMLEYKIRIQLVTYLAVGWPPLDFSRVTSYKPRDKTLVSKPSGKRRFLCPPSPAQVKKHNRW